jgi:IS1 family transposase
MSVSISLGSVLICLLCLAIVIGAIVDWTQRHTLREPIERASNVGFEGIKSQFIAKLSDMPDRGFIFNLRNIKITCPSVNVNMATFLDGLNSRNGNWLSVVKLGILLCKYGLSWVSDVGKVKAFGHFIFRDVIARSFKQAYSFCISKIRDWNLWRPRNYLVIYDVRNHVQLWGERYNRPLNLPEIYTANFISNHHLIPLAIAVKSVDTENNSANKGNPSPNPRNDIELPSRIKLFLSILVILGASLFIIGMRLNSYCIDGVHFALDMFSWWLMALGTLLILGPIIFSISYWIVSLADNTVPQKYSLTSLNYRGTVIATGSTQMANVLDSKKQVAIISALAEGSSIRSIERITSVHRDTIMRLGVRVGKGCANILDHKMRNLPCRHLEFDEIWGFIGKKERHLLPDDDPQLGDVWTFCAIDADTKLVPSFKVGKRDSATANAFVSDVAGRLKNRVQISSDALRAYVEAVEQAFGANVDFAQIVKAYVFDEGADRHYSAPEIVITEKRSMVGRPDMDRASTSYVERLNGTTRLHMRRLTRLTYAFSKKLENFEAAVALHFAYYNFVKRHNTLRATPAMAAGIERDFWTVENLVEAAA